MAYKTGRPPGSKDFTDSESNVIKDYTNMSIAH